MRGKFILKAFIGMALTLFLSSCAQVQVKDSEWLTSLGPNGAAVDHMLSNESSQISLGQFAAKWNDLKNPDGPLTCTRYGTLVDIKGYLEKLCSWNPQQCTIEIQQIIQNTSAAVNRLSRRRH